MKLSLYTYNGTDITAYKAKMQSGKPPFLKADVISSIRASDTAAYGGKSFQPVEFEIGFALSSADPGNSTRNTQLETIGQLFNPRDTTLRTLVALDTLDSNAQYYIECTPITVPGVNGQDVRVTMWTNDPVWKKVTASTKTINVSGGGTTTDTVTNSGNVDTYPSIAVTPTATGGSYAYRRHSVIYNPISYAQPNYPIDITNGGFDTSALVNDTSVSNQINQVGGVTAAAGQTCPIDTAVGGGLPASGTGYCDTEQFTFTISAGTMTWVTRGINGTTAATHADNAVIKRSLIKANGDDIGVMVNGVSVERWLGGTVATDTTLKVWVALDFAPKVEAVLYNSINSSGEAYIQFKRTSAGIQGIRNMPDAGIIKIENEIIAYTSRNVERRQLFIADNGRGVKDTTAASHVAGVTIYWLQYDIVLYYGGLSQDAPTQTDVHKPCFSLENSTNTNWRYDSADSVFGDESGQRSGGWKPSRVKGAYSDWYGGNEATYDTDPFTDMGAEIVSFESGGPYKSEQAKITWTLNNNAVITSVSSIGSKYAIKTTTPWPVARLESSVKGTGWAVEWTEARPASAATWTAWTHASETIETNARYVRFHFMGAVNPVSGATARFEINLGSAGSTGVSFNSSNVPQVSLSSQFNNAYIDLTLSNTTTSESFTYSFPAKANTTITFDTENRYVSYENRYLAPPETSTARPEWLRLQPGSNTITYTDSSGGTTTVVFTYRNRKNI